MKIRSHGESHLVELEDGSRWQVFPGDLDVTLNWRPETELDVVVVDDEVSSLIGVGATFASYPRGGVAAAGSQIRPKGRLTTGLYCPADLPAAFMKDVREKSEA